MFYLFGCFFVVYLKFSCFLSSCCCGGSGGSGGGGGGGGGGVIWRFMICCQLNKNFIS